MSIETRSAVLATIAKEHDKMRHLLLVINSQLLDTVDHVPPTEREVRSTLRYLIRLIEGTVGLEHCFETKESKK